jgi:hypothetical protein
MTNLFGSLDIEIWDFIGIWCLEFDISEYLNNRDSIFKDYLSIGYSTVKFHTRCQQTPNPETRNLNTDLVAAEGLHWGCGIQTKKFGNTFP